MRNNELRRRVAVNRPAFGDDFEVFREANISFPIFSLKFYLSHCSYCSFITVTDPLL